MIACQDLDPMRSLRGIYPMKLESDTELNHKVKLCTATGASLVVTYRKHPIMPGCNNSSNGSDKIQQASEYILRRQLLGDEMKGHSEPTSDVLDSVISPTETLSGSVKMSGLNTSKTQQSICSSDCGSNEVFPQFIFRESCFEPAGLPAVAIAHDNDIRRPCRFPEEWKIIDTASVTHVDDRCYSNIDQNSCRPANMTFLYGEDVPAISFLQSNGTYNQDSWTTYTPEVDDEIRMLNLGFPPPLQFSDDVSALYDHSAISTRPRDDVEYLQADMFLSLDGADQHIQVDVESSFSQRSWSEFFENSSTQDRQKSITMGDAVETSSTLTHPIAMLEAATFHSSEERSRTETGSPSDVISTVSTRKCKNLRRNRKRRIGPLSIIRCLGLLSNNGNLCTAGQEQSNQEINSNNAMNNEYINVFSRRLKVKCTSAINTDCANASGWMQAKERLAPGRNSSPQVEQYNITSNCETDIDTENGGLAVTTEGACTVATKSCNYRRPYARQLQHVAYRRVPHDQICDDSPVRKRKRSGKGKRTVQASCARANYKAARSRVPSALLPAEAVTTLREWFYEHINFPFANKEEKLQLVSATGLALSQVENWLSNYRHKLKIKRMDYHGRAIDPQWANAAPSLRN